MNKKFLNVLRLDRILASGSSETLEFEVGANLMIGRPNTGKTKWLQTLDYLLGDSGDSPYDDRDNPDHPLSRNYSGARAILLVGDESLDIERRWKEPGVKGKVFVNGAPTNAMDFQLLLLEKLEIPVVSFPKGNPLSGQTWPHLTFRILLRHIYRQQRFWSGLVDQQSDPEQHAALLQFLGLAEHVFTDDYGRLVSLKSELERLRSKWHQHGEALNDLAKDILAEPGLTVDVNEQTVADASRRLSEMRSELLRRRSQSLSKSLSSLAENDERIATDLGERRAILLTDLESVRRKLAITVAREAELRRYVAGLKGESERIERASDASFVLADLKITHCPACDQVVQNLATEGECFLCHQSLSAESGGPELGHARLKFEQKRIKSELSEAHELVAAVEREITALKREADDKERVLRSVEEKLAPIRQKLSPLVQDGVTVIDMQLGEFAERQRHISRIGEAVKAGKALADQIQRLEREISPLQDRVDDALNAADFDLAASRLADGMNAYLSAINELRPGTWNQARINVVISKRDFEIKVGSRRWDKALGATNSLYLLMAYHYGLLSLSKHPNCNYPGLSIIDIPGEFTGDQIADMENFVVQPFVDLVSDEAYEGTQFIITGPSFTGLEGARRLEFTHIYAAR